MKDLDFDKWLEQVKLQKNSRLLEILNSTDKYLQQLGAKVKLQKEDKNVIAMKGQNIPADVGKTDEEKKEEMDDEENE